MILTRLALPETPGAAVSIRNRKSRSLRRIFFDPAKAMFFHYVYDHLRFNVIPIIARARLNIRTIIFSDTAAGKLGGKEAGKLKAFGALTKQS